jgi:hypothetical protein
MVLLRVIDRHDRTGQSGAHGVSPQGSATGMHANDSVVVMQGVALHHPSAAARRSIGGVPGASGARAADAESGRARAPVGVPRQRRWPGVALVRRLALVAWLTTAPGMTAVLAHNEHPLGLQDVFWETDPNILRTIALNFDFHGGRNTVAYRQLGRVERRGERECLVGPHFLFDVDDRFAFDIDETVTLELLFDRTVSKGFSVSYDHAVNPVSLDFGFDTVADGRWQWHAVPLERARFANRKYWNTDFSVAAPNAQLPPADYRREQEIALCGIRLRRADRPTATQAPPGRIELRITNERGELETVRAGLYTADGVAPLADASALPIMRFMERIHELPLLVTPRAWPSAGRYVFYIDGEYSAAVTPGEYTLVLTRGPEYRMGIHPVTVASGAVTRIEHTLERWTDMPAKGWYSADDHIHIERRDPKQNPLILKYTRAEDVHLSNLLQAANLASPFFPQYAFGSRGHYVERDYALATGQENPRTSHRGHSIGLNARRFHWDPADYFLYDRTVARIHEDGGVWGYAHVALDAFNVGWGLALDVPLGIVDFVEMLQMNAMNTDYLYDFLNMGFKLLPSAGSDYPYIHVAGTERVYAKLDGPFTVQHWFDAWRTRRSFVSNGPVIDFTVNGDGDAQELNVARGTRLTIAAEAGVNPDYDVLDRLELVVHGSVVASANAAEGRERLVLEHTFEANGPLWFALRAYGHGNGKAHTAPVYVYVDGDRRFLDRENVAAIAARYQGLLGELAGSQPSDDEEWELHHIPPGRLRAQWQEDKPALDERIARAMAIYQALIEGSR